MSYSNLNMLSQSFEMNVIIKKYQVTVQNLQK